MIPFVGRDEWRRVAGPSEGVPGQGSRSLQQDTGQIIKFEVKKLGNGHIFYKLGTLAAGEFWRMAWAIELSIWPVKIFRHRDQQFCQFWRLVPGSFAGKYFWHF